MSFWTKLPDEKPEQAEDEALEQALKNFRSSVHGWSEAMYSQPRQTMGVVRQTSWRVAAGWALGCVLAVGSVAGGVYDHHHRQEVARIAAAAEAARQQKVAAEQQARKESEDLLAKVDSDVSRAVPSAMEPLARLMADDTPQ
ncbi:MAG TPA: hypothetical protein VGT08_11160 [Terracidiphilus sp.]|nr:hypothetical protein [Terracidiphilus sp.]